MSGYPLKAVLEIRRRQKEAAAARLADATRERADAEAEEARLIAKASAARTRWNDARDTNAGDARDQRDRDARHDQGARLDQNERNASNKRSDPGAPGERAPTLTGAAAVRRALFVERRRDEFARAEAALFDFQSSRLSRARDAETHARADHLAAQQACEAFDKHEANFRASERRIDQRRAEDALDDLARAARPPRGC